MVNVKSPRCGHPGGCTAHAFYGLLGTKGVIRCAVHKEPGMVNVKSPRCDHPDGCTTQSSFGQPGAKKATRCASHKGAGMVVALKKK